MDSTIAPYVFGVELVSVTLRHLSVFVLISANTDLNGRFTSNFSDLLIAAPDLTPARSSSGVCGGVTHPPSTSIAPSSIHRRLDGNLSMRSSSKSKRYIALPIRPGVSQQNCSSRVVERCFESGGERQLILIRNVDHTVLVHQCEVLLALERHTLGERCDVPMHVRVRCLAAQAQDVHPLGRQQPA